MFAARNDQMICCSQRSLIRLPFTRMCFGGTSSSVAAVMAASHPGERASPRLPRWGRPAPSCPHRCNADALIPNTYEWTYQPFTSSLARPPAGWCLAGTATCARFFGGQTSASPYALMWQWSGGGGSSNGRGDFDQIDANRTP